MIITMKCPVCSNVFSFSQYDQKPCKCGWQDDMFNEEVALKTIVGVEDEEKDKEFIKPKEKKVYLYRFPSWELGQHPDNSLYVRS